MSGKETNINWKEILRKTGMSLLFVLREIHLGTSFIIDNEYIEYVGMVAPPLFLLYLYLSLDPGIISLAGFLLAAFVSYPIVAFLVGMAAMVILGLVALVTLPFYSLFEHLYFSRYGHLFSYRDLYNKDNTANGSTGYAEKSKGRKR